MPTSQTEPRSGFTARLAAAPSPNSVPALLSAPQNGDAVRCLACAHRCFIRPGRAGICAVRENRDGKLVSTVFGQAVSANVDPIEKKPLFHVYPASKAFSIATRGCNFHCLHCQNWSISQAEREGLGIPSFDLSPAAIVSRALSTGSRSIAYTYTEPTVFIEYVLATAELALKKGLINVLVTNGYQTPEALDLLAPVIDAANVDLKAFDDRFYRHVLGARLQPVLDTIVGMRERGIWIELTTLVIPGYNDELSELASLAWWIVNELGPETPWHVSRFFPAYRMSDVEPTPVKTIRKVVEIGRDAGLRHVYAGNVADDADTTCSECGETLIRRSGYSTFRGNLVDGRCGRCGHSLAGVGLAEWSADGTTR